MKKTSILSLCIVLSVLAFTGCATSKNAAVSPLKAEREGFAI